MIKPFKRIYTEQVKVRFDKLRQLYINRKMAIVEKEKNLSKPFLILGIESEVQEHARRWKEDETQEKFLINALLEYEYMQNLNQKERELIKYGAELRQNFLQECVKHFKNTS